MLVIILQIYTNSLQYTQISIETIFDQIPTYSLFSQIWYSSIFDHFPTSENFSIIFLFFYFSLSIIFLLPFSIKFRLQFSIKFCFPMLSQLSLLLLVFYYSGTPLNGHLGIAATPIFRVLLKVPFDFIYIGINIDSFHNYNHLDILCCSILALKQDILLTYI